MPKMNFQQEGRKKEFVAPTGGVTAGDYVLIEDALILSETTADEGDPFMGVLAGVGRNCPATGSAAFDDFQVVYWNDTDGNLVAAADGGTGDGHPAVGRAFGAKAEAATTASVLLDPFAG